MKRTITLTVNARETTLEIEPNETLLHVLRNRLDLLGAREGCSVGECGACTVLLDGKAVVSCLVLAVSVDGSSVTTIEGLGGQDPLQLSFVRNGAIQCGYCTPGMIMAAKAGDVDGNLCRCTGYAKIQEAIRDAHRSTNPQA